MGVYVVEHHAPNMYVHTPLVCTHTTTCIHTTLIHTHTAPTSPINRVRVSVTCMTKNSQCDQEGSWNMLLNHPNHHPPADPHDLPAWVCVMMCGVSSSVCCGIVVVVLY